MLAGGVLLFVSVLGYLLQLGGEEYAAVIQPFLVFLAILIVGFNLASSVRRAKMRVWINKHFFQTKFDYNDEWRFLSERLTPKSENIDYPRIAVEAILPIYHGSGGVCFIKEGDHFHPRVSLDPNENVEPIPLSGNEPFFAALASEWIFLPPATDVESAKNNELIPATLGQMSSTLIILPLVTNDELLGFITVSADLYPVVDFDWEDLDLMRMVGKQVSNFVAYHRLSNELVVTRQFEAFHQFTTFIVHDLKNLIAQQALVVQNASRFIDKPEFVADARAMCAVRSPYYR